MIRRPPRSTRVRSSAASDVYKRQSHLLLHRCSARGVLVERRLAATLPSIPASPGGRTTHCRLAAKPGEGMLICITSLSTVSDFLCYVGRTSLLVRTHNTKIEHAYPLLCLAQGLACFVVGFSRNPKVFHFLAFPLNVTWTYVDVAPLCPGGFGCVRHASCLSFSFSFPPFLAGG